MPPKKSKTKNTSIKKSKSTALVIQKEPSAVQVSPLVSTDRDELFPIAAIGASAGGLEAFLLFLRSLPAKTGTAFIYIQHQDPTHASSLSELLKKASRLPVIEVTEKMVVRKDHVYVMPPNVDMIISKGVLRLSPRSSGHTHHMPVDSFFKSLAEDRKTKAIGVILSGTASDGTLGLKAIKAADGITFAQSEKTAKYDGMPRSAIAAGCVDVILPPEEIAEEIVKLASQPSLLAEYGQKLPFAEGDDALSKIFKLLRNSSGVDFTHYKPTGIMRRISRRLWFHKLSSLDSYLRYLRQNPREIEALYDDILINVTHFFRDPETFESLKSEIYPKIFKRSGDHSIRLWVPGCSTGEEAYSLAISLLEHLGDRASSTSIQIFGTDISESAIAKARAGVYPLGIAADVSPERLRRYFTKTDQTYQISKAIRDLCIFARHNVVRDPPFSKLDLISCRNLLIYLGPVLQRKVIPVFHYALNPSGYLVLGNAETIGGFAEYFYPADRKYKIYTKKTIPGRMHFDFEGQTTLERQVDAEKATKPADAVSEKDVLKEGDRLILNRFAPASVVVNDDMEILQFRGQTGLYLEPPQGQASLNLFKMIREGLLVEVRAGIIKSKREKGAVRNEGLKLTVNGDTFEFNLEIIPFSAPRSTERFFLILFETLPPANAKTRRLRQKQQKKKRGLVDRGELAQIKQELAATKEYLQSIIEEQEASNEELRAANEEILSSNEELQSTNEEMETAKEELQSANEELTTLNEELQNRNIELSLLNNDLNNLLNSVQLPIVMLGRDLRIRRYTPVSEKPFNLIPSDVGRPITDINMNIAIPKLEEWLLEVIDKVSIREEDIQDRSGHWYKLQLRPYKTIDNKIDGAVLTLLDIETSKRDQQNRQTSSESIQSILESIREPTLILDKDLRVHMANDSFSKRFGLSKEQVKNQPIWELDGKRWNIKELHSVLDGILHDGHEYDGHEVEFTFPRIGKKKLLVHGRQMKFSGQNDPFVFVSLEDSAKAEK